MTDYMLIVDIKMHYVN